MQINRFLKKLILANSCLISVIPLCANADNIYAPRLDVGAYYFTDSPHLAATATGFLPILQSPTKLLFSDLRALFKNDDKSNEFNLALGFRDLSNDKSRMLGAYLFYDNKRSANKNIFQQATFGLEAWFNNIFTGGNFYFPFGKRSRLISGVAGNGGTSSTLSSLGGGLYNILVTQNSLSVNELSLIGGDLSLGYQVNRPLALFAGAYYFHSSTSNIKIPTILGPMLHLKFILDTRYNNNKKFFGFIDRITIDSQLQYDKERHWRWYAGIKFGATAGTPTRKLSTMERHMTEQPLRDIDVVSNASSGSASSTTVATDDSGMPIQIYIPDAGDSPAIHIGNPNVKVIGVNGTHSNFSTKNNLTDGQIITGGKYSVTVNGEIVEVNVASNGVLHASDSGKGLLRLTSNNAIRDLTITLEKQDTDPESNRAIVLDDSKGNAGKITIDNLTTNGVIFIERDGSGKSCEVEITNCNITTPSDWSPNKNPAAIEVVARNNATITNGDISNNVVQIGNKSKSFVDGIRIQSETKSHIILKDIGNNNLNTDGIGMNIHSRDDSNISISGSIENNTINSGVIRLSMVPGINIYSSGTGNDTIEIGKIANNQIDSTDFSIYIRNLDSSELTFNSTNGIQNNNMTSSMASGFSLGRNTKFNIGKFFGNDMSKSARTVLSIIGSNGTINVGDGAKGLSSANFGIRVDNINKANVFPAE